MTFPGSTWEFSTSVTLMRRPRAFSAASASASGQPDQLGHGDLAGGDDEFDRASDRNGLSRRRLGGDDDAGRALWGCWLMMVAGAPARPFWRSTSRAAASVRPGRSAGMTTTLGPSEMLRVISALGSRDVPEAGYRADGDALGDGLVLHPADPGFEARVVELLQRLGLCQ